MNQNLTIERITDDNLHAVWASCTEIVRSMAYPSFFCCGDWLKTSAENLCSADELFILLVKRDGCVRAVLPLVKKRNALGGRDLRFLGTDYYPDPVGLISSLSDRAACAKALQDYLIKVPGWDRFFLDWVLEDELIDWKLPGKPISVAPFKVLPLNFADLLGEFKQKKRYNLRSMVRKFLDAGGELVTSSDANTHNVFLEALFTLHRKRATERAIESSIEDPRIQMFHRRLVKETEKVRFYGLSLDHQLVAVIYGFEFENRFFYYQVAHDPGYGDLSPGSVLLFLVIEDCCSRGVMEFNFLQGDESYKGIWTDESRILYLCVLKGGTWRSRLLDAVEQANGFRKIALGWMGRGT